MKINYWIKRLFFKNKLFKEGAYHEAGHVVFSYLYGYQCNYTELDVNNPGDGRTEFVFGQNTVAVNVILNQLNLIFTNLTGGQQQNIARQAHWLSMIFCAGACVEAFYFKSFWHKSFRPVLRGPDLEAVNAVNNLLGQIHINPTQETLRKGLCLIQNFDGLKLTIEEIAKGILNSKNKRLDQNEILHILTNTNFNQTKNDIINTAGNICH
jgi:hypothetical protein